MVVKEKMLSEKCVRNFAERRAWLRLLCRLQVLTRFSTAPQILHRTSELHLVFGDASPLAHLAALACLTKFAPDVRVLGWYTNAQTNGWK